MGTLFPCGRICNPVGSMCPNVDWQAFAFPFDSPGHSSKEALCIYRRLNATGVLRASAARRSPVYLQSSATSRLNRAVLESLQLDTKQLQKP